MTAKEWKRAKELFSAAVGLPEGERGPFLDAQTDSPATVDEVRSLLATYAESPDFLDESVAEFPTNAPYVPGVAAAEQKVFGRLGALLECQAEEESDASSSCGKEDGIHDGSDSGPMDYGVAPERIGPYRILHPIGEGGMGIAYLAVRDDGVYRQQVAIKVLKGGSHAACLVRRFENERQLLAELDHPYIARLIDGGTTPAGQPYYAMEYVAGKSLIQFAQSRGMSVRERLALFERVCDAVSAAHRHLVIHGDIKPSNILVTQDGTPKLLDFGLARMIQPGAENVTMTMVLLTPGYASPEQVRGERLSTSTDIYSLGVLLFELLTGKSPYGKATHSPLELCRAICDVVPSRPSAAEEIPGMTSRQLRGDLDHIVLKALRKSPGDRYATVGELRRDIELYLDGFPVEAARGSTLYLLRKFVVRRRLLVSLICALILVASVATWRIWRAEQTAELRFNQVRQLAHAMVFDLHDAIEELPGSTMARKLLIERALEYLKALEATSGRNRDLQLELARAYTKIGTVQAAASSASLNDCAAGIQNLEHARSLLLDILNRHHSDEEVISALVDADLQAANVHSRRGEMGNWRTLRAQAASLLNAMAARHPGDYKLRLRALTTVAVTLDGEHNVPAALKAYEDVLAAVNRAPSDADTLLLEARTERDMAEELQALENRQAALAHQHASLAILRDLLQSSPTNTRFRLETSWTYTETGWLEHELHNERMALADFNQGMHWLREIAVSDPGNRLARMEIGKLEMTEAETVELVVSRRRAAEVLRDAISIFSAAHDMDPDDDDARIHIARSEVVYGALLVRVAHGDCSAGTQAYEKALEMASTVKDDYSATSVFDMHKLRTEVQQQLAGCRATSANQ